MSQWLVTQGNHQFAVDGIGQLKKLAKAGNLSAGDMIQPPGASDWIYAVEIPELKELLSDRDDDDAPRGNAMMVPALVGAGLLGVIVIFGGIAAFTSQFLPTDQAALVGEGGLSYSEMIVTDHGVNLLSGPEAGASTIAPLSKDQVLDLHAKRGQFYRAKTKTGVEGWVRYDQVLPMYQLGGAEVRAEYDPLYNPDRYVDVANASWQQLPDQLADQITVFQFMLENNTDYVMTDVVLLATIKDAKGHELEKVEIPIEGVIPAKGATMVGTLQPEGVTPGKKKKKPKPGEEVEKPRLLTQYTLDEMAKDDGELQLRYSSGIEVQMTTSDFTNAMIDILEIRAIPNATVAANAAPPPQGH